MGPPVPPVDLEVVLVVREVNENHTHASRPTQITDQRSMAGIAPTNLHFTRTLDAWPVHCSVWLCPQSHHVNVIEDESQAARFSANTERRGQVRGETVDVQVVPDATDETVLVFREPLDALGAALSP